jgi:hypothetical protein
MLYSQVTEKASLYKNYQLPTAPFRGPKDGNLKVQGLKCILDGREPQISAPEGFP